MTMPRMIDLHMHTTVSDGTDAPEELAEKVKAAGIELFSISDHDAIKGAASVLRALREEDPAFIPGVEFSCKDEGGQYHVLGYAYDPAAQPIRAIVETGHSLRMEKLKKRLDFLEKEFGFSFSDEDRAKLFALDNPGKPHIGNLMARYGYAPTKELAITDYLDKYHAGNAYVRPEAAIEAILASGGVPVLAHPSYGRGDDIIVGEAMDQRLRHLIDLGLQGIEAFYSGFTLKLQRELLSFAEQYDLYVTAGSDYHGANKLVRLGDTNLPETALFPKGLLRFLDRVMTR